MLNAKQASSRILIVKVKGKPGMRVATELHKLARTQHFEIMTAAGKSKLRHMLETLSICAVVIDVGREIGDTLTILRILEGFPAIPLFIFNSFILPRIEEKAREYNQIHYFENHNDFNKFITEIVAAVNRKKQGAIQGISLSAFLQLMNSEKWSGQVTVKAGNDQGNLYLQNGRLVNAITGELTGRVAWEKMAAWEKISVETLAVRVQAKLAASILPAPSPAFNQPVPALPTKISKQSDSGNIEMLHLIRPNRKIILNLKKLNLAVAEIRDILSTALLRTDIFLVEDGRSLAGWNSYPLACSRFAAITKSLIHSLQISGFPRLGAYYLLDLDNNQLLLIAIKNELQWGFLLKGTKERLGLLLNIVLPKAIQALGESHSIQNSA